MVTDSGKIIEVMLEQPWKALSRIVMTVLGMETLVTSVLSRVSLEDISLERKYGHGDDGRNP